MNKQWKTRQIAFLLAFTMVCGAFLSVDAQAAQETVRVKEKTVTTYCVRDDKRILEEPIEKTEYIYGEKGNLLEERLYKTYKEYDEELLWRKRAYDEKGTMKTISGIINPSIYVYYESHFDEYGHLMEPSSSLVDYYIYQDIGILTCFDHVYDDREDEGIIREYDSEGRLIRFEVTQSGTRDLGSSWKYHGSYEYQYDPEGRIRFVFGKETQDENESVVSTRAFEYREDGSYRCRYTSYGGQSFPETCLLEFRPDGKLVRLTYDATGDEGLTTDYSGIEFEYNSDGYWRKIKAQHNGVADLDYDLTYRMDGDRVCEFDAYSNVETRLWDYPVLIGHERHSEIEYDEYGNISRITRIPKGIEETVLDGEWYEIEYQYEYETVYARKEDTRDENYGKEEVRKYIESEIRLS